jgi:hypothetical protein
MAGRKAEDFDAGGAVVDLDIAAQQFRHERVGFKHIYEAAPLRPMRIRYGVKADVSTNVDDVARPLRRKRCAKALCSTPSSHARPWSRAPAMKKSSAK